MRDLIKKLPAYYRRSGVMGIILDADGSALDAADGQLDDADAQMLVGTSTTELARWERIFGIAPSDDPLTRRRERVLARKRGGGTGTVEQIKSVLRAFGNGDAEISEDYANYAVTITFVGSVGVPPHLDDVMAALDEIMPAHLSYSIAVTYRTWGDIAEKKWSDLTGKTWADVAEGEIE